MLCDKEFIGENKMARIACVDKTIAHRVELKNTLESAYAACRKTIGYVEVGKIVLCSKEELLINAGPDVCVIGSGFGTEEVYGLCKTLKTSHPNTSIIVLVSPDNFTLRYLRRLEKLVYVALRVDDEPVRLVHAIESLQTNKVGKATGKLITVNGVKGGVGSTSIVSGLVHAAQACGRDAVVIDLSQLSSFAFYIGAPAWHSPDYRLMLVETGNPDRNMVERLIVTAPNGISILPAPSGGAAIREIWLRDASRFEITLSIIEHLKDLFDVVIVDVANTEGVLPFALQINAFSRLLVSSHDPASVHLLKSAGSLLLENPGDGMTVMVINHTTKHGLAMEDIADFVLGDSVIADKINLVGPVPYDAHAGMWIGTGNTFYTEAKRPTQEFLESLFSSVCATDAVNQTLLDSTTSGWMDWMRKIAGIRDKLQIGQLHTGRAKTHTSQTSSSQTGAAQQIGMVSHKPRSQKPALIPAISEGAIGVPTQDSWDIEQSELQSTLQEQNMQNYEVTFTNTENILKPRSPLTQTQGIVQAVVTKKMNNTFFEPAVEINDLE